MKNLYLITAMLLVWSLKIHAQIPNNGFENWTTIGTYEDPDGWATMNSVCPSNFKSCTKSNDHYPASVGSFSIRLENNTALTQATGSFGITSHGGFYYPFKPTFKITGHPGRMNGYYKFDSKNSDSCWIMASLFKNGVRVSKAQFMAMGPNTWTSFDELFDTYGEADSATFYIFAFTPNGPAGTPKGNSVLYVDNLSFDGLISGQDETGYQNKQVDIFPNPATESIQISLRECNSGLNQVNIYNVNGSRLVSESTGEESILINTSGLSTGLYFVEIKNKDLNILKRILIQNK